MRRLTVIALAIGALWMASAQAQIWIMSPANQSGRGPHGAAVLGALMLEDGASFLLLEDNSSHLCLEGGC